MSEKSGSGCLKSCAVGCASVVALGAVLAVGAWMGRDSLRQLPLFKRISATVESAKSEAVQMGALSSRLRERYPAGNVATRVNIQSTNGVTTRTLVVTFVDPEFPIPESAADKEEKAREIARSIAVDYPTLDTYDQLRLAFVTQSSSGASLGSSSEFQFPTAELLGKPAAAP